MLKFQPVRVSLSPFQVSFSRSLTLSVFLFFLIKLSNSNLPKVEASHNPKKAGKRKLRNETQKVYVKVMYCIPLSPRLAGRDVIRCRVGRPGGRRRRRRAGVGAAVGAAAAVGGAGGALAAAGTTPRPRPPRPPPRPMPTTTCSKNPLRGDCCCCLRLVVKSKGRCGFGLLSL